MIQRFFSLSSVWVLCLFALPAQGAGFEFNENGARIQARAGAFTARADHPMTIHNNPAGLLNWRGHRLYVGANVNLLSLSFERSGIDDLVADGTYASATSEEAGSPFVAPSIAWGYGAADWAVGLGVYGPGAVGKRSFDPMGPQRFMIVEENFLLAYATLAGAYRLAENLTAGVALQLVTMPLAKMSLIIDANYTKGEAQSETDPWLAMAETDMADWAGFSAIVGLHYKATESLEIGFSSRVMPLDIHATGNLNLSFPNPDTQRLLDNGSLKTVDASCTSATDCPASKAGQLELSLPPWTRFGVRYVARDDAGDEVFDVELDFFYEFWSTLDAYKVTTDYQMSFLGQLIAIDNIAIPKEYQDAWSIRLGSDVRLVPDLLKLHLGAHYESPAVTKGATHLDFTNFHRVGGSLGLTGSFGGFEVTLAYQYIHQSDWVVSEAEASLTILRPTSEVDQAITTNAGTTRSHYQTISIGMVAAF